MITPGEVHQAVSALREKFKEFDDDEDCHGFEDALRDDVLKAISRGADDPAGLAAAVLETGGIDFHRWCA